MKKEPLSYINLPIYSIAHYSNKLLFSGGGGHGIANQILIFMDSNLNKQVSSIQTQEDIIENMVVNGNLLACSANADILLWKIEQDGKALRKLLRWRCDNLLKNSTLNSLCWRRNTNVLAAGGDDVTVRVYRVKAKEELLYENRDHVGCLKHVDMEETRPWVLSVDNKKLVISDYQKKEVVRRIYSCDLQPKGCELLSAYFIDHGKQLIIINYELKGSCFLIKTENDMKKFNSRRSITDQSCLSAKNDKYIAVASGNGTVQLHEIQTLQKVGVSRRHDMVIKGICFVGEDRVATGTPQCSYHIQKVQKERNYIMAVFMAMCLFLLFFKIEGEL